MEPSSTGTITPVFRAFARRKAVSNFTPAEKEILAKPWLNTFPGITDWVSEQAYADRIRQGETGAALYRHMRDAMRRSVPHPKGLMLTSTDGFFAIYCLHMRASRVDVYDVCGHVPGHETWHLDQIRIVAKVRGFEEKSTFQREDLFKIKGDWDFCVCTEVLENLPDPEAALAHMRDLVHGPMALFSTTHYPNRPDFYESPAAARPWGSAFSHDKLIKLVVAGGWTVVNERNKLMPESWKGDRNLSYLHCV